MAKNQKIALADEQKEIIEKASALPRVRALQSFTSPYGSWKNGDEFTLPNETCRHWLEIGYCELAE